MKRARLVVAAAATIRSTARGETASSSGQLWRLGEGEAFFSSYYSEELQAVSVCYSKKKKLLSGGAGLVRRPSTAVSRIPKIAKNRRGEIYF